MDSCKCLGHAVFVGAKRNSDVSSSILAEDAAGCDEDIRLVQGAFGEFFRIGQRIGEPIAPAQALGQKNTVFAIWAGYTFFDPVSSIAGGFYSIFHNVWNSYQLSQVGKHPKS